MHGLNTLRHVERVKPVVSSRAVRQARHSQNAWTRHVNCVKLYRAKWNLGYSESSLISLEWMWAGTRWLPTCKPSCKPDLWIYQAFTGSLVLLLGHKADTHYRPSEDEKPSRPSHCRKCTARAKSCMAQLLKRITQNCLQHRLMTSILGQLAISRTC